VELKTLNGKLLQLPLADNTIITPNSELVLRNQVGSVQAGSLQPILLASSTPHLSGHQQCRHVFRLLTANMS